MTPRPGAAASFGAWVGPALLLAGLGIVVLARAWATRAGADPIVVGAVFGIALALIAAAGSPRVPPRAGPVVRALVIGLVFGLVLVALTVAGASIRGEAIVPGLGRPAAPLLPWAAVTILVASAEELLLRGRLFDATRSVGGVGTALVLTTVAFAVMHVPLYGWHVVPLDLAVGFALGGLRLATGGIVAPAAAHAVADLATWWL